MTKANIVELDDYREHWVINCGSCIHVVPDTLIDKWIDGTLPLDTEVCRRIIEEWRQLKND